MVLTRGNWQELKKYEGFQIYINPDTGQFGVFLGTTNDSWMARKDLKVIEREIRKRIGGIPVIIISEHRAWQAEVTAYEKDYWLTADGTKCHRWNVTIYPFDAQLLADLQTINTEFQALKEQEKQLGERWAATVREHVAISSHNLSTLLAEARAQAGNTDAVRDARIEQLRADLTAMKAEQERAGGKDHRVEYRILQQAIEQAETELRGLEEPAEEETTE